MKLHPRPDLSREKWLGLDGPWEYETDQTNLLDGDTRFLNRTLAKTIVVPFPPQSELSGIHDTGTYSCMWYRKVLSSADLTKNADCVSRGGRVLLHFEAVDNSAKVWLNGRIVGTHSGAYSPFVFDITDFLVEGDNVLLLKVEDSLDTSIPRGKQSWGATAACWYTPMSGIWQSVWLEWVPRVHVRDLYARVDQALDGSIEFEIELSEPVDGVEVFVEMRREGRVVALAHGPGTFPVCQVKAHVENPVFWTPESPALYDVNIMLQQGGETGDRLESYCAFRTVSLKEEGFVLNGKPYYLRLVLDQGYWPRSLYTAPDDDALRHDVELGKSMGFNGCRKHMKVESARFLYWADRLGYIVWSEQPAAYSDDESSRLAMTRMLVDTVRRDRGHPSIVAWVVYNESWGIQGIAKNPGLQEWVRWISRMLRLIDPSRPLIDNDGWEHVETDILSFHSYAPDAQKLGAVMSGIHGPSPLGERALESAQPQKRPLFASEFGGVAFRSKRADGWGYDVEAETEAEFTMRFAELVLRVKHEKNLAGFCYTQFSDVEQEVNGLLDENRNPKIPVERIRDIITKDGSKV